MDGLPTTDELTAVFGPESRGATPAERATTSLRRFVRGQAQIASERPAATGLRMTANWAFRLYGYEPLREAALDGSAQLIANASEPARTLRRRREQLGLTMEQVAKAVGLTTAEIQKAETPGQISPIRKLQRQAQSLGLNEDLISFTPDANGDGELGVRLRTLSNKQGGQRFPPRTVLKLAEAAWAISRCIAISDLLGEHRTIPEGISLNDDYHAPIWERGYELAARTRQALGIDQEAPIESVRLVVEQLGIPLIQVELGSKFAGATILNRQDRGIVVNMQGDNENVWVRRTTVCHELGHLLWDPAQQLNKLRVDSYHELRGVSTDAVEARANAFAIAFLAPVPAVVGVIRGLSDTATKVSVLMDRYGLSATSARYHLANVHRYRGLGELDVSGVQPWRLPRPSHDWMVRENWTADFFPISNVPIIRRGRFAELISKAAVAGLVTEDSAANWLGISESELSGKLADIAGLGA